MCFNKNQFFMTLYVNVIQKIKKTLFFINNCKKKQNSNKYNISNKIRI